MKGETCAGSAGVGGSKALGWVEAMEGVGVCSMPL